jgi:hypothetical protein
VTNPDKEPDRQNLRQVGERLVLLLEQHSIDRGGLTSPPFMIPSEKGEGGDTASIEQFFGAMAAKEHKDRGDRFLFLDEDLFCEAPWDILLKLYASQVNGKPLSITSACSASRIPSTTAMRWIQILRQRGLVSYEAEALDPDKSSLALTDSGMEAMNRYFAHRVSLALTSVSQLNVIA